MSARGDVDLATIRLFGPFEVRVAGSPVVVRGSLPVAVIARLAVGAGEAVPADELASAIWPEPPATAAGTLRSYVSRMRATPLGPALRGGRGGYAIESTRVDVVEFRQAALVALATGSTTDLERAESLWLGDPLRGIDAAFVDGERSALFTLRRRVVEALAEIRLEQGDLARAVQSLTPVVADSPSHEVPARLLATALARSGRTTEALGELDAFAARNSAPSPELAALRAAIVRHDPAVIPPNASGRAAQHGVSLPLTRFVGRRRELDALDAARRDSRLVTLTGPGGIGKTRLAIEALRSSAVTTDREQWFLELSSLTTEDGLVGALSDLVGASVTSVESIAGYLSGEATVLVLDNAEHLRAAAASVCAALLAASPGLSIVVTSREPLRVPGERLVAVSMMLDDDAADAVALFGERAADALPGFTTDARSERTVRRIVTLLDGVPLALELAAARLDVMGLDELADSIEVDGALTLSGAGEGRQASLQNTIAWSVALLSPAELELLGQLSLFSGVVSLGVIESICRLDDADVRETVVALAQKSLVAVDRSPEAVRYGLLSSVRDYARGLQHEFDPQQWQQRHAAWYADLADSLERDIRGPKAEAVHLEFDTARAELAGAMAFAIASGDRELALRLAAAQAWHWFIRGAMVDGKRQLDEALAVPGPRFPYSEARALWGIVMLIYRSGDKHSGRRYVERGLAAARDAWDDNLLALFLSREAMWEADVDAERCAALLAELEPMLGEIDQWALAEVYRNRSSSASAQNRPASAMRDLEHAIVTALGCGHRWAAADSAWRLAHVLITVNRHEDALRQLGSAIAMLGGVRDEVAVMLTVHAAALAATGADRLSDAARLFGATDAIAAQYGFDRRSVTDDYHSGFRKRAQQLLQPKEWNLAYRQGRSMSIEGVHGYLGALSASV